MDNSVKIDLTIVMVNYKSDKRKLHDCLKSINVNVKVLIIDHSKDLDLGTIVIPENISIEIIKNENLGNGAGINCGIKNAKTKYILYLDIDTVLPQNFFKGLENAINEIKHFAVMAPKIDNFYNDKKIEKFGNLSMLKYFYNKFFFNIKKIENFSTHLKQVYFVSGSIMLINREIILKNKIMFDENIFLFFEEDEFFHQCFKLNLKIFLINNLSAKHFDGSLSDDSLNYECFKKWHWEWSKYYFLNKHYNKVIVLIIALKNFLKFILKSMLFYFTNKKKFEIYKSRIGGLTGFYLKKKCKIVF